MSTEERIAQIYALPLAEFTAARNELAKEVRLAGDRDAADRIKKLPKPSISAWVVNRLYHEHRTALDDLLAAGAEQREALQAGGERLREAGERKRSCMTELMRAAEWELGRAGTRLSPTLRQRITRTLESLAAWPPDEDPPELGRLSSDLEPVGFDALLGARIAPAARRKSANRKAASSKKRTPASVRKRVEEAKAAAREAQSELTRARKAESAAKRALGRAETRAKRTLEKARAAERAADEARTAADEAQLELRKAKAARERAIQEKERREARLETARRKLTDLG